MREHKIKVNEYKKFINYNSKLVSLDRHCKNLEHKKVTNRDIFNKGFAWFENGLSFDEADDELKNDFNFVNGYEKAKRMKGINESLEKLGAKWFESGLLLEDASNTYINNPYFINGYNNARKNERKL